MVVQDLPKNPDQLTYNLTVTLASFTEQMDWLRAHAYHPITMDDLRAYYTGQRTLPSKPVVITLDDGYRDLYTTAYPILRGAQLQGRRVHRDELCQPPAVRDQRHDRRAEPVRHRDRVPYVDHPNLSRMAAPSVTYEVVASKQWLERLLGHPVVDFAYPSGRFNATDERVLLTSGYSTAVTEQESTYHIWATRFAWSRTRVGGAWKLADFIRGLGPVEPYVLTTTQVQSAS